jgi:integrase
MFPVGFWGALQAFRGSGAGALSLMHPAVSAHRLFYAERSLPGPGTAFGSSAEIARGLLFYGSLEGRLVRRSRVTRAWSVLAARAGVAVIRLDGARHTHASIMLKQGIHPKIVQERLGRSSIQMTLDTYPNVAPGLQEAAAARFETLVVPKRENEAVRKSD